MIGSLCFNYCPWKFKSLVQLENHSVSQKLIKKTYQSISESVQLSMKSVCIMFQLLSMNHSCIISLARITHSLTHSISQSINQSINQPNNLKVILYISGIVHENPRIGSDGESEEASGTSDEKSDDVSPVKLRQKHRRFSELVSESFLFSYQFL